MRCLSGSFGSWEREEEEGSCARADYLTYEDTQLANPMRTSAPIHSSGVYTGDQIIRFFLFNHTRIRPI